MPVYPCLLRDYVKWFVINPECLRVSLHHISIHVFLLPCGWFLWFPVHKWSSGKCLLLREQYCKYSKCKVQTFVIWPVKTLIYLTFFYLCGYSTWFNCLVHLFKYLGMNIMWINFILFPILVLIQEHVNVFKLVQLVSVMYITKS